MLKIPKSRLIDQSFQSKIERSFTMTKFETIGVEFQFDAVSKHAARNSFRYSCSVCCRHGMRIECDRCAIARAHEIVIESFNEQNKIRSCKQRLKLAEEV